MTRERIVIGMGAAGLVLLALLVVLQVMELRSLDRVRRAAHGCGDVQYEACWVRGEVAAEIRR